jgi:hypothetical protein
LLSTDVSRERVNSLPRGRDVRGLGHRRATPPRIPVLPEPVSTIIDRCDKSQSGRSDSGEVWLTSHGAPGDRERPPLLVEARALQMMVRNKVARRGVSPVGLGGFVRERVGIVVVIRRAKLALAQIWRKSDCTDQASCRRSIFARPYIWRLTSFSLVI